MREQSSLHSFSWKNRTSNTLNSSWLNISAMKYQLKRFIFFFKTRKKKKENLLMRKRTDVQRELIPPHPVVLVVKGLRNYPHVQRAVDWGCPRGRDSSVREAEWEVNGRRGFPYLNSKYLASRTATSPSGSQSDFRDSRGGRRSPSRDLSNKEERRFPSRLTGESRDPAIDRDYAAARLVDLSVHANRDRHVHLDCRRSGRDRSPVVYPHWKSQMRNGDAHRCIFRRQCSVMFGQLFYIHNDEIIES